MLYQDWLVWCLGRDPYVGNQELGRQLHRGAVLLLVFENCRVFCLFLCCLHVSRSARHLTRRCSLGSTTGGRSLELASYLCFPARADDGVPHLHGCSATRELGNELKRN